MFGDEEGAEGMMLKGMREGKKKTGCDERTMNEGGNTGNWGKKREMEEGREINRRNEDKEKREGKRTAKRDEGRVKSEEK